MKSAAYWEKRAISVMEAGMASADKVLLELEKAYTRAEKQVLGQIESLYARYAGKYGMTYDQAVKSIADSEYRQWRMTVAEYVERIMATGDKELLREFDTLSTRSRVTRLEQVEAAIKVNVAELRAKQEQMVTELLQSTYEKSYYRTAFNIQKALGLGKTLELLNPMDVANACAYPWSGASFSQRIWTNTDALARELRETITVGLIRGAGIDEMARNIRDKMGVSFSAAERIIRTETARVVEDAELQSYKDCGIDRYEILVQLDERTCKTCGPKDGQQHAVKSAKMGQNYPPFHPRCRCTTVAVFDDLVTEGSMRAAKEGKGGYRLVPADLSYEQWFDNFITRQTQRAYETIVAGAKTQDGIRIRGITSHALDRAVHRKIAAADVADALTKPLYVGNVKTDAYGRPSKRYVGVKAEAAINPDTGMLVSVNATGSRKAARLLKRLKEENAVGPVES